jgi:hypothetical protein
MATPTPTPKATSAATKPTDPVPTPEPVAANLTSTGPATQLAAGGASDENDTKTYYLRPGARHMTLVKGEHKELTGAGATADLTEAQYNSFKDKFWTKEEYDAAKKNAEAPAEGANAAGSDLAPTMEQPTVEEANALLNEDSGDKKNPNTGEPAE